MPQDFREQLLQKLGAGGGDDSFRSSLLTKLAPQAAPATITANEPRTAVASGIIWGTGPGSLAARKRIAESASGKPLAADAHPSLLGGNLARAPRILTDTPPTLAEITEASKNDPQVRKLLALYWGKKRLTDADFPEVKAAALERRTSEKLSPVLPAEAGSPGRAAFLAPQSDEQLLKGALRKASRQPRPNEINVTAGQAGEADTPEERATGDAYVAVGKPMSEDDVAKAVFEHLSAIEGGEEERFVREHPWQNRAIQGAVGATKAMVYGFGGAKLLGQGLLRLAPGLAQGMAAAPRVAKAVQMLGTIGGAEGLLQGQRVAAGGQKEFDKTSAAINILSTLAGSLAGRVAGNRYLAGRIPTEAAQRAANLRAAVWTQGGQNLGQLALARSRAKAEGKPFGLNELGQEIFQGLIETGVSIAIPELSPAAERIRPESTEAKGARAKADADMAGAVRELEDLYRKQQSGEPTDPDAPRKAAEAAQNVMLAREVVGNRDARRAELEAGMRSGQEPNLADALKAVERDMRMGTAGDRLMMAHEDYAERIGQQFGLNEDGARQVHERALELFIEPKAAPGGEPVERMPGPEPGFEERLRARDSDLERQGREAASEQERVDAEAQKRANMDRYNERMRRRKTRGEVLNPVAAIADLEKGRRAAMGEVENAFIDSMRGTFEKMRRGFERMTGFRDDAGLRASVEKRGAEKRERDFGLQRWDRERADFLRSTPNPATVDRAMTLAAEVGPEQGASIVTRTMPPEQAKRFTEVLQGYREVQRKMEDAGIAARKIPIGRYEVPGKDADGKPITREIVRMHGDPEPPPEAKLVGGAEYFRQQGGYVHHAYGKTLRDEARRGGAFEDLTLLGRIGRKFTPNWMRRRIKDDAQWLEQGLVSLDPTIRVMREVSHQAYIAGIQQDLAARPDLVRSEKELPDDARYRIEQAQAEVEHRTSEITALVKGMRELRLPIYADESGPLLKRMAPRKSEAFTRMHAHVVEMVGKGIPFEGWPDGFDPEAKGNERRAAEITKAQKNYRERAKTAFLYHQVERPDTLQGTKTRSTPEIEQANARLRELYMLKEIAEGRANADWVQVHGSHWGALDGKFIRKDQLRNLKLEMDSGPDTYWRMWDAAQKLAKVGLVAHNPFASGIVQKISNLFGMPLSGVNPIGGLGEHLTAEKQMWRYIMRGERATDPLLNELVEEGVMQGAGLLFDVPEATKRRVEEGFDRAQKLWKTSKGDGAVEATIAMFDALRWLPSQIPIFGRYGVQPFRLVDLAPMYGMYRQLRTGHGSERAPMDKERALAFVRDYYDMGDVPALMRTGFVRRIWDFGRWPVKSATALAKWAMMSPLSVGIPGTPAQIVLPRPFGEALKNPGTPEHRRALIANVGLSMALNATKAVAMWSGIQHLAAARLGIDRDDKKYQDRLMAESNGSWLRAQFLIPTSSDKRGAIQFYDAWNLTPWGAAANLFNFGFDRENKNDVSDIVSFFVNRSVLLRSAMQSASGTNWRGEKMSGPETLWTGARWMFPAGITSPAELAIAKARGLTNLTWPEIAARSLAGQRFMTSEKGEEYRYRIQKEREERGTKFIQVPVDDSFKARLLKKLQGKTPYGIRQRVQR